MKIKNNPRNMFDGMQRDGKILFAFSVTMIAVFASSVFIGPDRTNKKGVQNATVLMLMKPPIK